TVPSPFTVTQGSFQHFPLELWSKVKAVARARNMGIETWRSRRDVHPTRTHSSSEIKRAAEGVNARPA
ncbi:MAG: hypothetical protein AB7V46_24360, partial [Thermomicrobiales bacterium]